MKKIVNLRDLLLVQVRDLYDAELQQLKVLPELQKKVKSLQLKDALSKHVDETKLQLKKLDEVFNRLNEPPQGEESSGMKGLLDQAKNLVQRSSDPEVLDASLITAIQHISHYEIAGYGAATAYAKTLDRHDLATVLHQNLEEERNTDKNLSRLAEESINAKAKAPILM